MPQWAGVIDSVTVREIESMRAGLNDTMGDLLFYLSPKFGAEVD